MEDNDGIPSKFVIFFTPVVLLESSRFAILTFATGSSYLFRIPESLKDVIFAADGLFRFL
jgi:hypothetical protein